MITIMTIICFVGRMGSGKDTAASVLIEEYGYVHRSFAGKVKDVASTVFGWNREKLNGCTPLDREWREIVDEFWGFSPRFALQKIGTEMFREIIDPNVWVKSLLMDIPETSEEDTVITDCRFPNEYEALRKRGAKFVFVDRYQVSSSSRHEQHVSESYVDSMKGACDYLLENNGTLEDMRREVKKIAKNVGLN